MSYTDPKFNDRVLVPALFNVTSTGTFTASAHVVTNTDIGELPKFPRRTEITGLTVKVRTAPNSNSTGTKLTLKNGANTVAVATIGTLTANQSVNATMTAANQVFAAADEPTLDIVGTATASTGAVTMGNYDVYFEQGERFA